MTHGDKKIVDLFAKTALLENELAEAIAAQDRVRIVDEDHGLDRSSKNMIVGFVILIGVAAAWIVYQQFDELATQLDILNARTQQSIAASAETERKVQQQLDIAQQQVNATMLNDQRAWVWLSGIGMHELTTNQPVWITANTVNRGRTLALHAERTSTIVLAPKEPSSFPRVGKWQTLGLLTPNLVYTENFKGTEGLTQAQIDAINSGELLVVMYGTLRYDDVFSTPRFTDYCVVYTPETSGFSSCKKHNSAN
jgi:hypothetical protein